MLMISGNENNWRLNRTHKQNFTCVRCPSSEYAAQATHPPELSELLEPPLLG